MKNHVIVDEHAKYRTKAQGTKHHDIHQSRLFLEEVAQLIHHTATTVRRGLGGRGTVALRRVLAVILVLVLLHGVFGQTADDGTTDCPEEAVVGLVSCVTTGRTACESTCEATLAFLGTAGSALVVGSERCQRLILSSSRNNIWGFTYSWPLL